MGDLLYQVSGFVREVRPVGDGRWDVVLNSGGEAAENDPWFTVTRKELPDGIEEPRAGDMVTVTVPRLRALQRVTPAGIVGGQAKVYR